METSSTNLPLPLTSFIGRDHELKEINELLASSRLLTLTGAGGSGKTRLALQVASDLSAANLFRHGVRWVDFARILDPALVPLTVSGALDLQADPSKPIEQTLTRFLDGKQLLLVLDNCEHLIAACARLSETLLRDSSELKILATSREALSIPAEQVWPVPPLSLPDLNRPLPLDVLAQSEAIRLFVERGRAVRPAFRLTQQNAHAVTEICVRLDGIPLAIELAAVRLKALSPEQLAARLKDRFNVLTVGSRTALPRHQTLRALVDWSHDALPEAERVLFRRLAVFVGGWTLEAAEAVCAGDGIEPHQVLDRLTLLLDRSLVQIEERQGLARYRMLETIRQYAQDKLRAAGEEDTLRERHLHFFLLLAEALDSKIESAEWFRQHEVLENDYDNLRAALEAAQSDPDGESQFRLASALAEFWVFGNYQVEGRQWLARTLSRAKAAKPDRALRARVVFAAGSLGASIGPYATARALLAESVALFRELGDERHLTHALRGLAYVTAQGGDYNTACTLLEESLSNARRIGDRRLFLLVLARYGDILQHGGFPGARPVLEEAWALAQSLDDKSSKGVILLHTASLDMQEGDIRSARTRSEQALALFRETGNKNGIAIALGILGEVARLEDDYPQAEALYQASLDSFREVGLGVPWILHNLGHVALHRGDLERAVDLFKESLKLRHRDGEKEGTAEALAGLASVAAAVDQPLRAARLFGAADALRTSIHLPIRRFNRAPYDRYLPLAQAHSDAKSFAAAWSEGRSLSLDQAIEYALTDEVRPRPAAAVPPEPLTPKPAGKGKLGGLTAREREVVVLIAQGKSNRAIAAELVVGLKTVEAHITRIRDKLGFTSRAEVAGWAIGKGLALPPHDQDIPPHAS